MARTKGVTPRQIAIIRNMSRRGYGANKINRTLRAKHIGMRRTKLLTYVREFKGRSPKPHPERYVRVRYRKTTVPILQPQKTVILRGTWKHEKKVMQKTERGNVLKDWVIEQMSKAKNHDGWDMRPQVTSE
jgi:hypothetical protein